MSRINIIAFILESNLIEGIDRAPFHSEIDELERFLSLDKITVEELAKFVSVYEPKAKLRDKFGLNVVVGDYAPPPGGAHIRRNLETILSCDYTPYELHIKYELLHPFTDCNGRSGRALWAWGMTRYDQPLREFLKTFYRQTLQYASKR